MLDLASDRFSNHGCNDLSKEVLASIIDEEELCEDIRKYNNSPEDPWPEEARFIGDSMLMSYLSNYLKTLAQSE